jgi:Tol biopolymer transport system component
MKLAFAITLGLAAPALAAPPAIFAPNVISGPAHDAAPAFTPDGQTVYFSRQNANVALILVSYHTSTGWSMPVIAPFSGEWNDMEPTMAPDGSFLIFVSNRPAAPNGHALDGSFNGRTIPNGGGNLWRVDRKGNGWSAPVRLPDRINRTASTFAPSISRDGSIYFMEVGSKGKFTLFRAQHMADGYAEPVGLPFGDPAYADVDPAVAPDESYLVFGSSRPPAQDMDLFIVKRTGSGWGTPIHLGTEVNSSGSDAEARLSPDGKTLYFSSERILPSHLPRSRADAARELDELGWNNSLYNIWQVDLGPWLR